MRFQNTERLELVLHTERPNKCTGDMGRWFTGKACGPAKRSHINYCVYDSTFEERVAKELDRHNNVKAWVKNDHLGFDVFYLHRGGDAEVFARFSGETGFRQDACAGSQGELDAVAEVKRKYLREWTQGVTASRDYGIWEEAIVSSDTDLNEILNYQFLNSKETPLCGSHKYRR